MEKLRYYLQWWFEFELPSFVERHYDEAILQIRLIPVLVGPRRSGKSTFFFQFIKKLRQKISAKNIIYLNYEDDRLLPLTGDELSHVLNIFRQTYQSDKDQPVYLFLDEVQNVPQWEKIVRRIYETEQGVRLYLTGSNSKMLSREIASALRERTISYSIFPLSFKEFLSFKNQAIPDADKLQYSSQKDRILFFFDEYLHYGGFPEVVLTVEQQIKERILKEYLNTIFFKDIVERYAVRQYKTLDIFIKIISRQMASLFSFGKLKNSFNSIGMTVSKNTLIEYLSYMEEAFLGRSVSIYSYSVKDQFQYPRKFYLIDNGLYGAASFIRQEDKGRLLENLVFNTLLQTHDEIHYWKDKNGYEVDFLLPQLFGNKDKASLIQVCYTLEQKGTKKRELNSLLKASKEFKTNNAVIITHHQWDYFEYEGLQVRVVPFIQWALKSDAGGLTGVRR